MGHIPELGAERIVLPHVNMVETLGRIAGEFHDGAVGTGNIAVAGDPAGLKMLRDGVGDLRRGFGRVRLADRDRCRC